MAPMVPGCYKKIETGATMAIQKKVEKKVAPPPEVIPSGYEKYITFDPKESDELATIANSQGEQEEPSVKHLGYRILEDGRHERSFLKKIVKKLYLLPLIISLFWCGNVFASRASSGLNETRDFAERQVNINLDEIFARTRNGAEINPVHAITAATMLPIATADIYTVTGDTTITRLATDDTWIGRTVRFFRRVGSTTAVTFVDGENMALEGNQVLDAGDSLTVTCADDTNWYQVASSDN